MNKGGANENVDATLTLYSLWYSSSDCRCSLLVLWMSRETYRCAQKKRRVRTAAAATEALCSRGCSVTVPCVTSLRLSTHSLFSTRLTFHCIRLTVPSRNCVYSIAQWNSHSSRLHVCDSSAIYTRHGRRGRDRTGKQCPLHLCPCVRLFVKFTLSHCTLIFRWHCLTVSLSA